jgi:hypothetical protein
MLAVALVLIGTGALAFVLRDAVREFVVFPLAYLLWLADRFARSVPQAIFLGLLVAAATVIVLRAFGRRSGPPAPQPRLVETRREGTRLGFWARQMDRCEDSAFASERLAMELRDLVTRILADEERLSPEEILTRVRAGTMAVPDDVHALLTRPQDWLSGARRDPLARVISAIRAWLRMPEPARAASALDGKLQAVAGYIEKRIGGIEE